MFGKVFASLWQGSMVGQSDAQLVFVYMIANCDSDGHLDQTQEVIAALTGIPVERVQRALDLLSAPDPRSRTTDHEGRRIMLVDPARGWGWLIVNHAKYMAMRNEEVRRVQNRERMRKVRAEAHGAPLFATVRRGAPTTDSRQQTTDEEEEAGAEALARSAPPAAGRRSRVGTAGDADQGEIEGVAGRTAARRGESEGGAAVEAIPLANGSDWVPTVAEVEEWVRLFPGVDVAVQFRRMRAWALANEKKRKTERGVRAFIRTWLDREQNDGRGSGGRGGPSGSPGDRLKTRVATEYRDANT